MFQYILNHILNHHSEKYWKITYKYNKAHWLQKPINQDISNDSKYDRWCISFINIDFIRNYSFTNQSINQSNPVLLKERVRIPRTRRAGGAPMLWGALPLDGVGSCRLFFTDDLHDTLSWVPASDKPHTFKSSFTHSSQVFFGRQVRYGLHWAHAP